MSIFYGGKEEKYAGCVLNMYEHNGAWDSDYYAVVWDDDSKSVKEVCYDTTRFPSNGSYAEIDCSDATIRKTYRYFFNKARQMFDENVNESFAKEVFKNDKVVVVKGRKIPKGTIGRVFWVGLSYNRYSHCKEKRVGIELENGDKVFVPYDYVEVIGWESRILTGKNRIQKIRNMAENEMRLALGFAVYGNKVI